ncbi:ATP-dependent metallopeptidase FtsH/Yme1/Tma family protein, partial [Glaesserella parasuis]
MFKNILLWVVIGITLMTAFQGFESNFNSANTVEYSTFIDDLKQNRLREVNFKS